MAGQSDQAFKNKVILTILQYRLSIKTLNTFLPKDDPVDTSQLDITGLCNHLSNKVCLLPDKFDGRCWNKLPSSDDKSKGADVFRIRIRRNETFHAPESGIEQAKFKEIWDELEDIYLRALGSKAKKIIEEIQPLSIAKQTNEYENIKSEYENIKTEWTEEFKRLERKLESLGANASDGVTAKIQTKKYTAGSVGCSQIKVQGGAEEIRAAGDANWQGAFNIDIEAEEVSMENLGCQKTAIIKK